MTDWREYFLTYRERMQAEQASNDAETLDQIVVQQGHAVEVATLPRGAAKVFEQLQSYGFDVRCGMSESITFGRTEKQVKHYFVQAKHEFGLQFWGWWDEGSFRGALYAENRQQRLIDPKQKERTGETLSAALKTILERWGEQTCSFLV